MNASQSFAATHEGHECGLPRFHLFPARGRLRGLAVEETTGGAREEQCVVLLEVLRVDVRRIVRNRRRPGARLLADLFDGFGGHRDRRVHVAPRVAKNEDLSSPGRLGRCRGRQGGHHVLDVRRTRGLADRWQIGAAAAGSGCRSGRGSGRSRAARTTSRRGGWGRLKSEHRIQRGPKLVHRHLASPRRVCGVVPLAERGLHLAARHAVVFVDVNCGPERGVDRVGSAGASRRLRPAEGRRQKKGGGHRADQCH